MVISILLLVEMFVLGYFIGEIRGEIKVYKEFEKIMDEHEFFKDKKG